MRSSHRVGRSHARPGRSEAQGPLLVLHATRRVEVRAARTPVASVRVTRRHRSDLLVVLAELLLALAGVLADEVRAVEAEVGATLAVIGVAVPHDDLLLD